MSDQVVTTKHLPAQKGELEPTIINCQSDGWEVVGVHLNGKTWIIKAVTRVGKK